MRFPILAAPSPVTFFPPQLCQLLFVFGKVVPQEIANAAAAWTLRFFAIALAEVQGLFRVSRHHASPGSGR
jgi:hypothetical protein